MIKSFINTGNPLIRHWYTADPTALVHQDTLYLVTGHDQAPSGSGQYMMNDWLWFSSTDLINWTDHGSLWKATDFAWASGDAYASKFIERDGKFYLYASVSHARIHGKAIGVAAADTPTGPYRDALGEALISQETIPPTDNEKANLDPSVLIDSDGQAYLFWGSKTCYFAKLKTNMVELDGPVGTVWLSSFEEGAHIHKNGDWYYLCYGYQMPEKVAYAMSKSISGPWLFKGILNDIAEDCETNRPCIVDFKGHSYFFYHNGTLEGGGSHRRSVCVDELHYNPDGTIKPVVMTRRSNPVVTTGLNFDHGIQTTIL